MPNRTHSLAATKPQTIFAVATMFMLMALMPNAMQAQNFRVLHTFTGGPDGYQPQSGVTIDRGGHLYGTTSEYVRGTVYEMKQVNGSWVLTTLLHFDGTNGLIPYSKVVFGTSGALYGTTLEGGTSGECEFGCGAVYNILPSASVCTTFSCPWTGNAIASFTDQANGGNPNFVDPVFDQQGNLYGTTAIGGTSGVGVVFELTHTSNGWTENVLHNFSGPDGGYPYSGLIFDHAGNLYGTTGYGGQFGQGTVYQLSPSGSGWTLTTLYSFQGTTDGQQPASALIFDPAGNLYGSTIVGGANGGGTIFKLSPSGGSWNFSLVYSLTGHANQMYYPGVFNPLAMDAQGSLYGVAFLDGAQGDGSAFKLTPSNGSWTYTSLHDFTSGDDGANPIGGVTFDTNGNLFGTTVFGGSHAGSNCQFQGCGVVWEITP